MTRSKAISWLISGSLILLSIFANENHAAQQVKEGENENPELPTQPPRPTISPCKDQKSKSFCEYYADQTYCKSNFVFGRFQCCTSCVRALRKNAKIPEDEVVNALGLLTLVHPNPCNDMKTSSGRSWSDWCERYAMDKPKSAKISCHQPSVQMRCMRTCQLCNVRA